MEREVLIRRYAEVESTNDLARDPALRHGDIVVAERQTAGRGQQGNRWHSEPGANLLFSLVLEPTFLPAGEQFFLLEAVCLALADTLRGVGLRPAIKWPNDIYIGDRKIAGLLIEHDIKGAHVARSIVGIGLNVNQTEFPADIPSPTSVALERAGRATDRRELLDAFRAALERRYGMLEAGDTQRLEADYHALLWRLDMPARYRTPQSGEPFEATIRRVSPSGEITLEHLDGELHTYLFKQIEFL